MAKELPYFKFFPGEWVTGDITMMDLKDQGLFINICAHYWNKNGCISLENIKLRFKKYSSNIDRLITASIIKIDENNNLIINFLDEQINEFFELREKRKKAGAKGGLKNSSWNEVERKEGNQLYILFMNNKEESFIKIGVTEKSISRRYSIKPKYKIITLYQLFCDKPIEHEIKLNDLLKNYKHETLDKFPGYMECYDTTCIDIIDNYMINTGCKPLINHKQIISKSHELREDKIREDKRKDFIDKIVDLFKDAYEKNFELPYEITNKGKEKGCAGKILKIYKDKCPEANSEETLKALEIYFNSCCQIEDNWLSQNMSLPIILNKFNEINKILRNGKSSKGATNKQLAEMLANKFGTDRKK